MVPVSASRATTGLQRGNNSRTGAGSRQGFPDRTTAWILLITAWNQAEKPGEVLLKQTLDGLPVRYSHFGVGRCLCRWDDAGRVSQVESNLATLALGSSIRSFQPRKPGKGSFRRHANGLESSEMMWSQQRQGSLAASLSSEYYRGRAELLRSGLPGC